MLKLLHDRFGIPKIVKPGIRVSLFYTMLCNYNCDYCSARVPLFKGMHMKEKTAEEWVEFFEIFLSHTKIKHVTITGGEPTIRNDLPFLVNWLLGRGVFVSIYTNLTSKIGLQIPKSRRLRFIATYHADANKQRFLMMYGWYKNHGHKVIVEEIENQALEITDRLKPFEGRGEDTGGRTNRLAIAPDGMMFVNMEDFYTYLCSLKGTLWTPKEVVCEN